MGDKVREQTFRFPQFPCSEILTQVHWLQLPGCHQYYLMESRSLQISLQRFGWHRSRRTVLLYEKYAWIYYRFFVLFFPVVNKTLLLHVWGKLPIFFLHGTYPKSPKAVSFPTHSLLSSLDTILHFVFVMVGFKKSKTLSCKAENMSLRCSKNVCVKLMPHDGCGMTNLGAWWKK